MTPLDKALKRSVRVDDKTYTLTIDKNGLKLTPHGHRLGMELSWGDLVRGDAALAQALQASLKHM
jgi:hypothetical protein